MTKEELEHIQNVCRQWLAQPGTASNSHLTISAGGALTRTVELVAKTLLTFDNVLFKSALDAKTGAIYTGFARQPDGTEEFFDTPYEKMEKMANVVPPALEAGREAVPRGGTSGSGRPQYRAGRGCPPEGPGR